jgi:hypothetical protein
MGNVKIQGTEFYNIDFILIIDSGYSGFITN